MATADVDFWPSDGGRTVQKQDLENQEKSLTKQNCGNEISVAGADFSNAETACHLLPSASTENPRALSGDSVLNEQHQKNQPSIGKALDSLIDETPECSSGQKVTSENAKAPSEEGKKEDIPDMDSDDEEMERGVMKQVWIDTNYPTLRKPLTERMKVASKRVVQHMSYARLLEDRLQHLEQKVEQLEMIGPDALAEKRKNAEKPPSPKILEVKRYSLGGWSELQGIRRAHKRYNKGPALPRYVVSVVVSNTEAAIKPRTEKELIEGSRQPPRTEVDSNPIEQVAYSKPKGVNQNALRVKVASGPLLNLLTDVSGQEFATHDHQTFLPPFKLFATFETEIRERVAQLRRKYHDGTVADTSSKEQSSSGFKNTANLEGPAAKSENEERELITEVKDGQNVEKSGTSPEIVPNAENLPDSRECLAEAELLMDVFDHELKGVFEKRRQIEQGIIDSILFSDLWHLFRCGEDVVDPKEQLQICRVLDTWGGRPFLCTKRDVNMPTEDSYEEEERKRLSTGFNGKPGPDNPFVINTFHYDFNGKEFVPVQTRFTIQPYDGQKLITLLPCYPIQFSRGKATIPERQEFINRGKRFTKLAHVNQVAHKEYDGLTMDKIKEEIDSEIIVDFSMAFLRYPEWEPKWNIDTSPHGDHRETYEVVYLKEFVDGKESNGTCNRGVCCANDAIHKDYAIDSGQIDRLLSDKKPHLEPFSVTSELDDDDFILFPRRVYGFVLRTRRWATFDVNSVQDVKSKEANFDSLVLPEGHKETLLALVKTHAQGTKPAEGTQLADQVAERNQRPVPSIDLVRGKGKGLIILLHGEPGVGKTSTAECVAEYTHRPLFSITCGDIGQTAEDVEEKLEHNFQLAHKWGCVLLLDEADVFLARRTKADLHRNAVVSVFLRVLEYYSGILFLTTNRIGTFDPAFRSRIHMSLFYPKLTRKATEAIWQMNLERTKEMWAHRMKFKDKDVKEILSYAKEHYRELKKTKTTWNGRQIRNAFQTATAIAEYEAHETFTKHNLDKVPTPVLEKRHFEKVAKASSHFDRYLKETWGEYAEDLARNAQERRDDFGDSDLEGLTSRKKSKLSKKERDDETSEASETSENLSDVDDVDPLSSHSKKTRGRK